MSLFKMEACLWMHTMFDWNRDKTADLAELSNQLWDLKRDQIKGRPIKMIWYDADLSLSQSGDLLQFLE